MTAQQTKISQSASQSGYTEHRASYSGLRPGPLHDSEGLNEYSRMTAPETSVGGVGTCREAPTPSPPLPKPWPFQAAAGSGIRVGGWPDGPVKNDRRRRRAGVLTLGAGLTLGGVLTIGAELTHGGKGSDDRRGTDTRRQGY